jgi:hypothetical protein
MAMRARKNVMIKATRVRPEEMRIGQTLKHLKNKEEQKECNKSS